MTKNTLNRIHDSIKIHEQTREFLIPKGKPPSCPKCGAKTPSEYIPVDGIRTVRGLNGSAAIFKGLVCFSEFHNFNPNAQSSSHLNETNSNQQ